jgi:hypothetical protein
MYRGSSKVTILALRSTCGSSLYPFDRSAWKWNSANFAITEFSDVWHSLGPHPLLAFLTQIGSLRVQKEQRASSLKLSVPMSEWKHFLGGVAR